MPSSYTPKLRLTLPVTGELSGLWGDTVNSGVTTLLEAAVSGWAAVAMTDATYTLTTVNGSTDEARQMFLSVTGTLTTARNVICPTSSKLYFIKNSTTGGFAITLKTVSGTGISIPNGKAMVLACDGTNVLDATTYFTSLSTGALTATSLASSGALSGTSLTLSTTPLALASGGLGATTAAGGRTTLGSTVVGDAVFVAATAAAARGTLGSTTIGDALFVTATALAARKAILSEDALMPTISVTMASGAATVAMTAGVVSFRDASLADGTVTTLLAAPTALVIPSGATLGTSAGVLARVYVGVMNNAGTPELFVCTAWPYVGITEADIVGTTGIDATADSLRTVYAAANRANFPFRMLGYFESTQSVPGTWSSVASKVQSYGGQARDVEPVYFRAYKTSGQALTAGAVTQLSFTAQSDPGGLFSTPGHTDTYTIPVTGLYTFSAAATMSLTAGDRVLLALAVNGTEVARLVDISAGRTDTHTPNGSAQYYLAQGAYVSVNVYCSAAVTVTSGTALTYFSGCKTA
jgi:hypothetical protein